MYNIVPKMIQVFKINYSRHEMCLKKSLKSKSSTVPKVNFT